MSSKTVIFQSSIYFQTSVKIYRYMFFVGSIIREDIRQSKRKIFILKWTNTSAINLCLKYVYHVSLNSVMI